MKKTAKKPSPVRAALKTLLYLVLAAILVVVGYVGYVFLSYDRLPDNLPLTVNKGAGETMAEGETYTLVAYNIGFCAYTADFGFFMDGGTESCARSAESVREVEAAIVELLQNEDADIMTVEEVDTDATRSWHIDETAPLYDAFGEDYDSVFAQNYDSAYLFYPVTCPHGASKSGLLTFSRFPITSSVRRSLPVETGVMKLVDLDRCYSVSRIPVGDRELVLYTVHLSAYTSDGSVGTAQLRLLVADMQSEYLKGNYTIASGDFNKDLINSNYIFNFSSEMYTWAQPLPDDLFNLTGISAAVPLDEENPVPSCRNADGPYYDGQFVVTPDGFFVSDNVTVLSAEVIDTGFAYSDHNPVRLTFVLGK